MINFVNKIFLILTFCILSESQANDPNPENAAGYEYHKPRFTGNIDDFSDEQVIVLFRGINYLPDLFTQNERQNFIADTQIGQEIYASASYELAGEDYGAPPSNDLDEAGGQVAEEVNSLDNNDPCFVNKSYYPSCRYAMQELYSNNYKKFHNELNNPSENYAEIFNNFSFTCNPLVSFSDRAKHPLKYAYGLKNYGEHQPLLPHYDLNGRPRYPVIGRLYGVILDEATVEEVLPFNAYKAHKYGLIKLYDHYSNNIVKEREISIPGYVPGDAVTFEMDLEVPSFEGDYPEYYKKKYGLTKTRYNNYKKFFTCPLKTAQQRQDKTRELLSKIIEPGYIDNAGTSDNTLVNKLNSIVEKTLDHIGAKECKLTLDYTLE